MNLSALRENEIQGWRIGKEISFISEKSVANR